MLDSDTNCIVSFQTTHPQWISNSGLSKVVQLQCTFQNGLENWRRESCFSRTMLLHTSLWLQRLLCVTVTLNWLITLLSWHHLTVFFSPTWKKQQHLAGKQNRANDEVIYAVEDFLKGSGWELLYHRNPSAATPMEEVCGLQGRLYWKWTTFGQIWPLHYKAHLHWQKPKSKKPGFFVVPFTLPEKPIAFGFLARKSACAKKPESYTCVLVSGAHSRLLSTFDRTRVVRITSRGRGRVIPLKVTYHVTKNLNNTGEIGASVYIGKKPVKLRRSFKKITLRRRVFWSV